MAAISVSQLAVPAGLVIVSEVTPEATPAEDDALNVCAYRGPDKDANRSATMIKSAPRGLEERA
jgi:hypothetical protein